MRRTTRATRATRAVGATGLAAAALVLAGCSSELPDFTAEQVGDAVASQVEDTSGTRPDEIVCQGLVPEVDEQTLCSYHLVDRTQDVDVTVTEVDDTDVLFRIAVTRTYLTGADLAPLVTSEMTAAGSAGTVTCPDTVDLERGARTYCQQAQPEGPIDLAVTVASGAEDALDLTIEIDDRVASEDGR